MRACSNSLLSNAIAAAVTSTSRHGSFEVGRRARNRAILLTRAKCVPASCKWSLADHRRRRLSYAPFLGRPCHVCVPLPGLADVPVQVDEVSSW